MEILEAERVRMERQRQRLGRPEGGTILADSQALFGNWQALHRPHRLTLTVSKLSSASTARAAIWLSISFTSRRRLVAVCGGG